MGLQKGFRNSIIAHTVYIFDETKTIDLVDNCIQFLIVFLMVCTINYVGLPYVPLFEALSRFFHRKSRFLLKSNRAVFTKFMEFSINLFTQAGR